MIGYRVKRKKILFIHHGIGLGGAPKSLRLLIEGLDKDRFEPVVLALHESDATTMLRAHGITVLGPVNRSEFSHTVVWWYRLRHLHLAIRALWDQVMLWWSEADTWLDAINPDLVHLNTTSLAVWAERARARGLPVIWHVREPLAPGYWGLRRWCITRLVSRYASKILPICCNDARPWYGDSRVTVVYNAVDTDQYQQNALPRAKTRLELGISDDVPVALYMGGYSYEKGFLPLLKIWKKVVNNHPKARLMVAGYVPPLVFSKNTLSWWRQDFSARYMRQAQTLWLELQESLIFIGPQSEMVSYLQASDMLLCPTVRGHFARPVIEAASCSIPSIVSDCRPLDELVVDRVTGYLIDINDHDRWAEMIGELCEDELLRNLIGAAAQKWCLETFSRIKQAEDINSILKNDL